MARTPRRAAGTGATPSVDRGTALRHRAHVQQLTRPPSSAADPTDAHVLDLGVQDTGPDGALWALAVRGVATRAREHPDVLAYAWTLRGAPHAYRRAGLRDVERAVRPWSDDDAARRIFDAARPLRAAGIGPAAALGRVASALREVVDRPRVKGEVSTALTALLPAPYLRECRPCGATHAYEQTFRLAALHAGLELEPGTSPPVLRRVPRWTSTRVGDTTPAPPGAPLDLVHGALHLLGPTTRRDVATFLDAAPADVAARWPDDAVDVLVDGRPAQVLADDLDALLAAPAPTGVVRLLGPFDLWLQARDRDVVVPDPALRRTLWPTLGRPGAVLADGEVVGTWRPRTRGRSLALEVEPWTPWDDALRHAVDEQHRLLAAFRGVDVT
ncbi:DNA glycosylase AlkZ-like family protein [Cellulomonas iranensis]|uniref:Winged helix DNA-binding domain-containing protein n=1 Tax=Cellulomonas iranensis TaxID=76862 RepID=A0ABU0GER7_9CELL|nr:crosslink repair DNA glycosylase YcaQ family protein [Cellulomonas iranensis]MDQ0423808.1 hypothetical protein [Cellulomonas iranensis]